MATTTFFLLASLLALAVARDSFEVADLNADGQIDRSEFGAYISTLKAAMDPFLVSPLASKDPLNPENMIGALLSGGSNFVSGFFNSLLMILVTEIGDKTFFIAAVLAMSHGRMVVYLGAMGALAVMHVLSSIMGYALPNILPKAYTHFASALLFVYFGGKLLYDAYDMKGEGPSEELQEVEEELVGKKETDVEDGDGSKPPESRVFMVQSIVRDDNLKVFTQAFTLTFLAEWGDRSQIATIALAASKNVLGVVIGGLIGHAFCTGLAVIGGRMLAARISEKTVAIVGGVLFLIFAIHSFVAGP